MEQRKHGHKKATNGSEKFFNAINQKIVYSIMQSQLNKALVDYVDVCVALGARPAQLRRELNIVVDYLTKEAFKTRRARLLAMRERRKNQK